MRIGLKSAQDRAGQLSILGPVNCINDPPHESWRPYNATNYPSHPFFLAFALVAGIAALWMMNHGTVARHEQLLGSQNCAIRSAQVLRQDRKSVV